MKALGTKISELRKARGMTQDELADKMGVSPQAVSKWENDLSMPDLPVLIELSDFFHISLDDFLKKRCRQSNCFRKISERISNRCFESVCEFREWRQSTCQPAAGSGKNGQRYGAGHPADDRQSNDAENRSGNDYAADREWCDRKACRSRFCKRRSCRSDCRIA